MSSAQDIPKPPPGLPAAARADWRRLARDLVERGAWSGLAADTLNRYVRSAEQSRSLRAEHKRIGSPAIGQGSKGQDQPHALLVAIERAERAAQGFADDLAALPGTPPGTAGGVGGLGDARLALMFLTSPRLLAAAAHRMAADGDLTLAEAHDALDADAGRLRRFVALVTQVDQEG